MATCPGSLSVGYQWQAPETRRHCKKKTTTRPDLALAKARLWVSDQYGMEYSTDYEARSSKQTLCPSLELQRYPPKSATRSSLPKYHGKCVRRT